MLYTWRDVIIITNRILIQVRNNTINSYDICGKPGGGFLLGVLGVLMDRSGYL